MELYLKLPVGGGRECVGSKKGTRHKTEGKSEGAEEARRHSQKTRKKAENVKVSGTGWGLWWPPSHAVVTMRLGGKVGNIKKVGKWEFIRRNCTTDEGPSPPAPV